MEGMDEIIVGYSIRAAAQATLRGETAKAIDTLKRLMEIRPDQRDAKDLLGRVYARVGRYDEAIEAWQDLLESDPGNQAVRRSIAKAVKLKTLSEAGGLYSAIFSRQLVLALSFVIAACAFLVVFLRADPGPVPQRPVSMKAELIEPPDAIQRPSTAADHDKIDVERIRTLMREDVQLSGLSLSLKARDDRLFIYGSVPNVDVYKEMLSFFRGIPEVGAIDTSNVRFSAGENIQRPSIDTRNIISALKKTEGLADIRVHFSVEGPVLYVKGAVDGLDRYGDLLRFLRGFPEIAAVDTTDVHVTNSAEKEGIVSFALAAVKSALRREYALTWLDLDLSFKDGQLVVKGKVPTQHIYDRAHLFFRELDPAVPLDMSGVQVSGRYRTVRGETFKTVAARIYGDRDRWREILEKNKKAMEKPLRVQSGFELVVPVR